MQLKIEAEALKKETDDASKERREKLLDEAATTQNEYAELDEIWRTEKSVVQDAQQVKEALDRARVELETARRASDLTRMSELQYGRIPALEKQLHEVNHAESHRMTLLRNSVGEAEVAEIVSKWTGIPVSKMLEGERDKLLRMEDALHERVIGQNEAVAVIANAIRRSRAGLADPDRPNGSFLFLGPTGVGKTELTKALAGFLFDSDDALVRIDMSEFMEKHSVARLIGAPPGYVGYDQGGYLTEAVRRKPYSVVLLDEVEKAHPEVFNLLLQVLEDGRLTDGQGRTVDFRNTVIIMTSNLGSQTIKALEGENNYEKMKDSIMSTVAEYFRPEFINRIDETVVFHSLNQEHLRQITAVQIERLRARLAELNVGLAISNRALDKLATVGFDPVFGARPLKRAIQQRIENQLAQEILAGHFRAGDQIDIDWEGDNPTFRHTDLRAAISI